MPPKSPSPATDSPWFWVRAFSIAALGALVAIGPKYGRRQAKIEVNYQARERVAAQQEAGNNSADETRSDELADRRSYASADDTLVPLWPLAAILLIAVLVSSYMLATRDHRRPASHENESAMP